MLLVCSECLPIEEPKYSKFDFEEKLLEKMVRMEHTGGVIMMKEFQEIATNVKVSLETMRREFDDIKREVQERGTYTNIENFIFTLGIYHYFRVP